MNNENNNTVNNSAMNFGAPTQQPVADPAAAPVEAAPTTTPQPVNATPVTAPVTPPPAPAPVAPQPVNATPVAEQPVQAAPVQPAVAQPVTGTTEISGNTAAVDDGTGKKKTPIALIIVTILVLIGVGVFLTLYLTGKINFGGKNTPAETNVVDDTGNTEETPVETLTSWMSYIMGQNITEITIKNVVDGTNVTIDAEQLRNIFNNASGYQLNETYVNDYTTPDGYTELAIKYTKEDTNYGVYLVDNQLLFSGSDETRVTKPLDEDLLNSLEGSNPIVNEDSKDQDGYNASFTLDGFSSSIYDEYLTQEVEETTEENQEETTEEPTL